ncbi:MAG: phosphoribosyltransferase family protein [Victivallaceae bacterium]|jgi:hypoxanthine phosphoribosyltransferase|nr:phosphoribosyltransferase family protein [Victivallaceae bacterium]MDD3117169.1 phosphoribosyltransferase family protein [Victivallaceae bacterium]MDD3703534.1 phosphoribosyltransferase family protein [Victivallaceae bacterium]MDD4317151.1 phosphoribosyltransferase family protein [Victivallaceae bacterium]
MPKPPFHLRTRQLISERDIAVRITEMGTDISRFYGNEPLTLIVILNGAMIFGADLARAITIPMWLDSMRTSSYISLKSSGQLDFASMPKLPLAGRHILLVDDILDTGLTLSKVSEKLNQLKPLSLRTCVLLDKQIKRVEGGLSKADWCGFEIKPHYVVGYGLDAEEYYRNHSNISIVEEL